jgi:hypothetical protein
MTGSSVSKSLRFGSKSEGGLGICNRRGAAIAANNFQRACKAACENEKH